MLLESKQSKLKLIIKLSHKPKYQNGIAFQIAMTNALMK